MKEDVEEDKKGRKSRRTKCFSLPTFKRRDIKKGVSTAPAQKALFDFLLQDLLSLLKCLIGFINF